MKCDYKECPFTHALSEQHFYHTDSGQWCIFHLPPDRQEQMLGETHRQKFMDLLQEHLDQSTYFLDLRGIISPYSLSAYELFGQESDRLSSFGRINFDDAVFWEDVLFGDYSFAMPVSFRRAKFRKYSRFKYCVFNGIDFEEAEFHGYANFKYATFNRSGRVKGVAGFGAGFSGSKFYGRTDFSRAKFMTAVTFANARFIQCNQKNSENYPYLSLKDAELEENFDFSFAKVAVPSDFSAEEKGSFREITFEGANFWQPSNFSNRVFSSTTVFTRSIFEAAPKIYNASFHEDTHILDAEFLDLKSTHAARTYEILKKNMVGLNARQEAIKFYLLERRSLRKQAHTSNFYKLTSWLDDITSAYGYNPFRAFWILLALLPIFFLIYYIIINTLVTQTFDALSIFEFMLQQVFSPFKILTEGKGLELLNNESYSIIWIIKFVATINSLAVFTMTSLFILSLKRQTDPV